MTFSPTRRYQPLFRCLGLLILIWFSLSSRVWAGALQDRVEAFPHWRDLPPTEPAQGDLFYPDWFEGTWQVNSTLVALESPLAPAIITPGFEGNRQYLHQTLSFQVRFLPRRPFTFPKLTFKVWQNAWQGGITHKASGQPTSQAEINQTQIVADRAFNGFQITQAYLSQTQAPVQIQSVTVDPQNPNRQVTTFLKNDRDAQGQLKIVSTVTDRATETLKNDRFQFMTTEMTQQFFRNRPQVYLNRVETTTAYQWDEEHQRMNGEQFTAIYLSPQDPQYFEVLNQPVALYHYHLELMPLY